ncbi:MAG: 50S ribosomal protein L4 [Phycisphaerales bacterium]|nr:50S ribosomal protein L4 [Phycisphaerales bacterium]
MDVPVYSMSGAAAGTMSVDEIALGETVNADLLKQAFVMYHANRRQGSARSKNRKAVAYTGKKMYKQKGTGRARHRDKGAVQFRGGGHAKQKTRTREDYHQSMPKKMRRKANRNALLAKLLDNEVRVIDGLSFDSPRTKDFVQFLDALKVDRSALVALSGDAEKSKNARLSARNVDGVQLCRADQLNAFEMLNNRYLVIDKGELEAWLNGPSSHTGKAVAGEA